MENSSRRRVMNKSVEENICAILGATDRVNGKDKDDDDDDDRITFLEAVRAVSIVPANGIPPSNIIFEKIFKILESGKSFEVIMPSYQLLHELDKRFPRLYLSNDDAFTSLSSCVLKLVVVEEAWLPFILGSDNACSTSKADGELDRPLTASDFALLIKFLTGVVEKTNFQALNIKSLRNMLLFQYLVNVLEGDFLPRNSVYKDTLDWDILRESLLSMLLGSKRIKYKDLIKDCLSIMSSLCHVNAGFGQDVRSSEISVAKRSDDSDNAVGIASLDLEKCTCIALRRFLVMIMELDMSKSKADMQGHVTRADGVRTPLAEIILDELAYNKDILSPFLQAFNEPKWKLEMVLQYLWKYIPKPSVRTRKSNDSTDERTLEAVLKCFSDSARTNNILKKISSEDAQLLLAHGLQAYLSLSSPHHSVEEITYSGKVVGGASVVEMCNGFICAISNIRRIEEDVKILPFAKEALFTAATILSTKSKADTLL